MYANLRSDLPLALAQVFRAFPNNVPNRAFPNNDNCTYKLAILILIGSTGGKMGRLGIKWVPVKNLNKIC